MSFGANETKMTERGKEIEEMTNPNPTGRAAANAAVAKNYQARVEKARAWLGQADGSETTRRQALARMPMSVISVAIWHYAQEYAGETGLDPRTAKRHLLAALKGKHHD